MNYQIDEADALAIRKINKAYEELQKVQCDLIFFFCIHCATNVVKVIYAEDSLTVGERTFYHTLLPVRLAFKMWSQYF